MSVAESFANYLQDELSIATIGTDLWIGQLPSSLKVPDTVWWIIGFGGDPTFKNSTGEVMKQYTIEIRYRNIDPEVVYNSLQTLEESLNSDLCSQITGYDTVDIEATTFPVDDDLDSEDRKVGLLRVTILT